MKSKIAALIAACMFFIPFSIFAQSEFAQQDAIISRLTGGIQKLRIDGAPGLINVFGDKAFTIVTDGAGRSLMAGATYGKGKVVVLTHGDWVAEKHMATADNNRLMGNIFMWAARDPQRMKVFSREMNLKYKFTDIPHLQFQNMYAFPDDLRAYDLILIDFTANSRPENFNDQTIAKLKKFVADGGGIICFALGWVYNYYGEGREGKSLEKDFIGNIFLKDFGLAFNGDFTVKEFQLSQSAGNQNHPLRLLDRVAQIIETRAPMPYDDVDKILAAIQSNKGKFPYNEKYLSRFEGYYDSFGPKRDISPKNPILRMDVPFVLTVAMLNSLYQSAPHNRVGKMKDADIFPGMVGAGAAEIERNIPLDMSKIRWQSTGLYAPAGRIVAFTVGAGEKNTVMVRIGAHSDSLIPFDDKYRKQFNRGPDISMTKVLDGGETLLTSPYGGLIYLEKTGKPENRIINVRINGAVQAPYFKLGETRPAEWKERIRYFAAPWGELAGDRIIITFSSDIIKRIDDPEKLMRYWDKAASYYHELQQEPPKNYAERFVHDVQPKLGWLHAGYPIVVNQQVSRYTAGLDPLDKGKNNDIFHAASWGHLHELGHNCQKPEWTFDGATEVTVNLFTLYVIERMDGTAPVENQWHKDGWPKLKRYIANGAPFEEWKKDPQLALETYILLQKDFGWDAFKKVFAAYQKLTPAEKPKNDQEKRDLWVTMFSNTVKRDLGPYYTRIGMPVSAGTLMQIKKYPVWMPENL
ncbi:MAG: M60 family metallopeptidase [Deltaproteobacteria bacterium]